MSKKRHSRGDVRSDGMVFWAYQSQKLRGGTERWVTPEKFKESIALEKIRISKLTLPEKKLTRGETRDDGMVFWSYGKGCKNGEVWLTPFKYEEKKERCRQVDKKRNKTQRRKNIQNKRKRELRKQNPIAVRERESKGRSKRIHKIRKTRSEYNKKKRREDPVYAMKMRIYNRVFEAFRSQCIKKNSRTREIIGCSWVTLKKWIESKFQPGMSWENKGEWEIDHIVPLSCATTTEGLERLFHYKNCQPMWATENRSKQNKLILA